MATGEFKHISVTASEDEDEVIYVGASPEAAEEPRRDGLQAVGAKERDASSDEGAVSEATNAANDQVASNAGQAQSKSAEGRGEAGRGQKPPATGHKADPYRQTTLEDLNSQKMPLVQKIVIIAAVLCIIGAIGYYLAFMR